MAERVWICDYREVVSRPNHDMLSPKPWYAFALFRKLNLMDYWSNTKITENSDISAAMSATFSRS